MILFSFFFLLSFQLNIDRGRTTVNIDGWFYNFTEMANGNRLIKKPYGDWDYYIKFSHSLDSSDLPNYNTIKFLWLYNAVRCSESKQICQPLTTLLSYDFKPLEKTNYSKGLIYRGDSEPVYDETENKYFTFDIIHQLKCRPDKITPKPSAIVSFDDDSNEMMIYLQYNTAFGCPTGGFPTPQPTPSFNPDCKFVFRSPEEREKGLQFDLKELNGGSGGLFIPIQDKLLFYQPCERMKCPSFVLDNFSCSNETLYSSAWLCDSSTFLCENYGIVDETIKANLVDPNDLNKGITIHLNNSENERNSFITLQGKDYIDGHIDFDENLSIFENEQLKLIGNTSSLKIQEIIDPIAPVEGNCTFYKSEGEKSYFLNLSKLNKLHGYNKSVSLQKGSFENNEYLLMYQPCGFLDCPLDYDCDGDYDATVWLVNGNRAIGYGLLEHGLEVSLIDNKFNEGMQVSYYGDDKQTTKVKYVCDPTVSEGELILSDIVVLQGKQLQFSVKTADACIENMHPFIPPDPEPGPSPTPTPNPNTSPFFFAFNESYYISLNLSAVPQTTISADLVIRTSNYESGDMVWSYTPWNVTYCPETMKCPLDTISNIWGCYNNFCYDYGNKFYGISPEYKERLDYLNLHYQGVYDFGSEINLLCDDSAIDDSIDFSSHLATYTHNALTGKKEYTLHLKSKTACPQKFREYIPIPLVTPEPDPNVRIDKKLVSQEVEGNITELDLTKFTGLSNTIILSHFDGYERVLIYYTPHLRMQCPRQYMCDPSIVANVWKCYPQVGRMMCFAFGDEVYGLNITTSGENPFPSAYYASYAGGEGATQAIIKFVCDEREGLNTASIKEFNEEKTDSDHIFFTVGTGQVCPHRKDESEGRKKTTIGAIILMILYISLILYFVLGTIIPFAFTERTILLLPNAKFWKNFCESLVTLFSTLFPCCFRPHSYEGI